MFGDGFLDLAAMTCETFSAMAPKVASENLLHDPALNLWKTTPIPNKLSSCGITVGGRVSYIRGSYAIFCEKPFALQKGERILRLHATPHFMAYFGGIFFAKWAVEVVVIVYMHEHSASLFSTCGGGDARVPSFIWQCHVMSDVWNEARFANARLEIGHARVSKRAQKMLAFRGLLLN